MWLRTSDGLGREHTVKRDEGWRHRYHRCICNPRMKMGGRIVMHRVLSRRRALYTPLKGGGH